MPVHRAHYAETKIQFTRPVDVSVNMRQTGASSPECGVLAVFPPDTGRHSGYSAGIGWSGDGFGTGIGASTEKTSTVVHGTNWHTVRIVLAPDGGVFFYLDGHLKREVASNTQFTSGVVRLGNNGHDYQFTNLIIKEGENSVRPQS